MGKCRNHGGRDLFFIIVSPALSTWSFEKEKSVKSPIETGRSIFTEVMGAVLWGGKDATVREERRVWRALRVLVWADLGSAANALRVG
jgi:hypothetical protein